MKSIILTVIFILFISGCKESPKKKEGVYIVWVGGDIVQAGYQVNSYKKENGFIIFTNINSGKRHIIPIENIGSIEQNLTVKK